MTERLTFTTASERETADAGAALAVLALPGDVISLTGDLGAGKTTLVRGLARGLGMPEPVTSPTFNILVVHHGPVTLNHFDLYRLERAAELEDIDFWGVLESGGVSVIEWGDRFPHALPGDHLSVEITFGEGDRREFALEAGGPRAAQLARAWAEQRAAVQADR